MKRQWIDDIARFSNGSGNIQWNGAAPVGSIVPVMTGYFAIPNNNSYQSPVYANSIAAIKSFLSTYAPNWSVCDGSLLNDPESPIFNSSGRYLPNLTDSRFLMGSTAAGTIGGNATISLSSSNIPSHTHVSTLTVNATLIGHYHNINYTTSYEGSYHDHYFYTDYISHVHYLETCSLTGGGKYGYRHHTDLAKEYSQPTSANGAHNHGPYTSYGVSSLHTHSGSSSVDYNNVGHSHLASASVNNSGSSNSISLIPQNLSCFYIMRVK